MLNDFNNILRLETLFLFGVVLGALFGYFRMKEREND